MPNRLRLSNRTSLVAMALCLAAGVHAQSKLSLEEALKLAKERNGTVRSAILDVQAAESRVRQTGALFLPTITPSYRYNSNRTETSSGNFSQFEGGNSEVAARWRLLDSGERSYSLNGARRSAEAQRLGATQTLRSTLFTVHQQYFDTLRSQELLKVANSQVLRAEKVLDQVRTGISLRTVAAKDELQAVADLANARVAVLSALNRNTNSQASLKSTLGLETEKELPELANPGGEPVVPASLEVKIDSQTLSSLINRGVSKRYDLRARRFSIEAQKFSKLRLVRQAGPSFAVDAGFTQSLTPDSLEARTLTFSLSMPLFDGGASKEAVRESELSIRASEQDLIQTERAVRAEIESAYKELTTNTVRVAAAKTALEAARANYAAAVESQASGAADLIDVVTAQVSLVTAESNYIEAVFDYKISDIRLKLAVGDPLPGE